jgi:hypothetical protein
VPTSTPNYGLTKPDIGNQTNWGSELNTDLDLIDAVIASGIATCEKTVNKGQAGGYAGLDGTGKVPASQLPTVPNKMVDDEPAGQGAGVTSLTLAHTPIAGTLKVFRGGLRQKAANFSLSGAVVTVPAMLTGDLYIFDYEY